jgi:hypothetical protein
MTRRATLNAERGTASTSNIPSLARHACNKKSPLRLTFPGCSDIVVAEGSVFLVYQLRITEFLARTATQLCDTTQLSHRFFSPTENQLLFLINPTPKT